MSAATNPTLSPTASRGAETIVVGHDGSEGSDRALAMALDLADRLGAAVRVVRAWSIDSVPANTLVDHGYVGTFEEASTTIAAKLSAEAGHLSGQHPSVPVSYHAALGQPAAILAAESESAMMLVVGSRGHGGFSSLLLGSVSEQCARHAPCPVLIVRSRATSAPLEP